jgi:hypothetical protein
MNNLSYDEIECNIFDEEFEKKISQVNIRWILNRSLIRIFVIINDIKRIWNDIKRKRRNVIMNDIKRIRER